MTPFASEGDIEFHNVWFKYSHAQSDTWILKNFSLKIKAGESLGIKGESGSGKSTLIQLLLRFYDPQRGRITINGVPITDYCIKSLRSSFGLVQQEPMIFNTSIMNNIAYGKQHASAQEIENAARTANALQFVRDIAADEQEQLSELDFDKSSNDARYSKLDDGFRVI